jgi:hypothetical protein
MPQSCFWRLHVLQVCQGCPNSHYFETLVALGNLNLKAVVKFQKFQASVLSKTPTSTQFLALQSIVLQRLQFGHHIEILGEISESFKLIRWAIRCIFSRGGQVH